MRREKCSGLWPAAGRLTGAGGFDELLTGSLGIDKAGFVASIESQQPSYLRLEAWVKEHTQPRAESVAAFNATILRRDMKASKWPASGRVRFGIASGSTGVAILARRP
jgi:hypothetical protein